MSYVEEEKNPNISKCKKKISFAPVFLACIISMSINQSIYSLQQSDLIFKEMKPDYRATVFYKFTAQWLGS